MRNLKTYFRPTTIPEAVRLLREQPGKGALLAGGTNLVVTKDPTLDFLVDVHALGLDYLREQDGETRIGAAVTVEELYHHPLSASLANGLFAQVANWFASKQIRNVATIGGNIAEGLSAADFGPALLAMDAQVVLVGERERTLPMMDVYRPQGRTVLDREIIKEFVIPSVNRRAKGKFLKNARTHEDIAIVSVTVNVVMDGQRCQQARIALGAVAPTPIRILPAEALLEGQIPSSSLIEKVAETVVQHIRPIDNFRATAEFRRTIARVYTQRALTECFGL